MRLDDQLRQYFGTGDLSRVTPEALAAGTERITVDLGLEKDRGRRFALWVLLYVLGAAPDLEAVFDEEADRAAARRFMEASEMSGEP
jgi:hypothetical protein